MTPAEDHRAVAADFSVLVAGVGDWSAAAPVAGWTARDVVGHLVTWLPGLLAATVTLPAGRSVADDPVGAWADHEAAVQALLDDPASADLMLDNPYLGRLPVPQAIAQFYTSDVFLHSWDLARASGQPVPLDPARCEAVLAGMQPYDELLRSSGQYGPAIAVDRDASPVDRLMGFIGRDPRWSRPDSSKADMS